MSKVAQIESKFSTITSTTAVIDADKSPLISQYEQKINQMVSKAKKVAQGHKGDSPTVSKMKGSSPY